MSIVTTRAFLKLDKLTNQEDTSLKPNGSLYHINEFDACLSSAVGEQDQSKMAKIEHCKKVFLHEVNAMISEKNPYYSELEAIHNKQRGIFQIAAIEKVVSEQSRDSIASLNFRLAH